MNAMKQHSLLPEGRFDQKFPLPSRERVRVRGLCKLWLPSPHSSPVKGEEVIKLGASNKSTRALLSNFPSNYPDNFFGGFCKFGAGRIGGRGNPVSCELRRHRRLSTSALGQ